MICQACMKEETIKKNHIYETCVVFLSERNSEILIFNDDFGSLYVQKQFIRKFKVI